MGHGIAQVAAQNGFQVTAVEMKKDALDAGMGRLASLCRLFPFISITILLELILPCPKLLQRK
jgi:hypothetical protein